MFEAVPTCAFKTPAVLSSGDSSYLSSFASAVPGRSHFCLDPPRLDVATPCVRLCAAQPITRLRRIPFCIRPGRIESIGGRGSVARNHCEHPVYFAHWKWTFHKSIIVISNSARPTTVWEIPRPVFITAFKD